jgi:hypothetical protein
MIFFPSIFLAYCKENNPCTECGCGDKLLKLVYALTMHAQKMQTTKERTPEKKGNGALRP